MTRESRPAGAALTDSLAKRVTQNDTAQATLGVRDERTFATRYGLSALASECTRVTTEGTRESLLRAAARMGQLVGGGELAEELVRPKLLHVGRLVTHSDGRGYSEGELRRIVSDGLRMGARAPRGPGRSVAIRSRSDARIAILAWQAAARAHAWMPRRRATARRLIDALAQYALSVGTTDIRLSVRELAERAGVGRDTAARYLRSDLSGWVSIRGTRRAQHAGVRRTLRLNVGRAGSDNPAEAATPAFGLSDSARTGDPFSGPSHDIWNRWPTGRETYRALDPYELQTAAEVAHRAGVHPGSARRNLRELERLGLAARDPDGGWTSRSPSEAPATYPYGAERELRHEHERQLFRSPRQRAAIHAELVRRRPPTSAEGPGWPDSPADTSVSPPPRDAARRSAVAASLGAHRAVASDPPWLWPDRPPEAHGSDRAAAPAASGPPPLPESVDGAHAFVLASVTNDHRNPSRKANP